MLFRSTTRVRKQMQAFAIACTTKLTGCRQPARLTPDTENRRSGDWTAATSVTTRCAGQMLRAVPGRPAARRRPHLPHFDPDHNLNPNPNPDQMLESSHLDAQQRDGAVAARRDGLVGGVEVADQALQVLVAVAVPQDAVPCTAVP